MSEGIFPGDAGRLAARFSSCRILVVGDIMLDEYIFGAVSRISPEAPVPVVAVTRDARVPGGAANVALNLSSLNASVEMAGLIGTDSTGRFLTQALHKRKIGVSAVIQDPDRPTTLKTRVVAHGQQIVRVDREKNTATSRKKQDVLIKRILALMGKVQGVVLSDYRKGVLSAELVQEVIGAARKKKIFVAVDPKQADFSWYKGCTLLTPNKKETEVALGGKECRSNLEVLEAGKELLRKTGAQAILVTRGEEGMTLVERRQKECVHIPALARQVFDVTGAGDTVISTLAVCLAAGASMRDAAVLANIAAGVVVGEVGTSPITTEKLLRAVCAVRQNGSR